MILVFCAVYCCHRWMMVFLMAISSQISFCVVLLRTAPHRVYCFVGDQTEQEETPQFRECAFLSRKSPKNDFGTSCGVNFHGFHNA